MRPVKRLERVSRERDRPDSDEERSEQRSPEREGRERAGPQQPHIDVRA